jgi:DNA-binding CsgD family transcriptional regulator
MRSSARVAAIRELCCLGLDSYSFALAVLSELHTLVPSVANSYIWLDAQGQVTDIYDESPESWRLLPLYREEFLNRREREAAPSMTELAARSSGVITTSAVATREFYRSALYNEVLRPSEHDRAAAVVVREGERRHGMLMFHRGLKDPDFNAEELRLIEEMVPFIAHGFAAAGQIRFPLVEDDESGLMILDRNGAVVHASARARHLLFVSANGPSPRGDRGAPPLPPEVVWLCRRLQASGQGTQRDLLPPVWRQENRWGRFTYRAHWLDATARADSPLIGVNIAHEVPLPHRLWRHARRLGLSPKQLSVCGLLATGLSYEEIAQRMGVTHHTVTDHVRKLSEKLAVDNRTELVMKLMSV